MTLQQIRALRKALVEIVAILLDEDEALRNLKRTEGLAQYVAISDTELLYVRFYKGSPFCIEIEMREKK